MEAATLEACGFALNLVEESSRSAELALQLEEMTERDSATGDVEPISTQQAHLGQHAMEEIVSLIAMHTHLANRADCQQVLTLTFTPTLHLTNTNPNTNTSTNTNTNTNPNTNRTDCQQAYIAELEAHLDDAVRTQRCMREQLEGYAHGNARLTRHFSLY